MEASQPIPAQFDQDVWIDISAESAGWTYTGFRVVSLDGTASHQDSTFGSEAIFLPLSGSVDVSWSNEAGQASQRLTGRQSVFSSATDFLYLPPHSEVDVSAEGVALVAVCSAVTTLAACPPARYYPAETAQTLVRGAGNCSRQIVNYALGNGVPTSRLLVCEAITPGGNWSSYPPHKHDIHSEHERVLEETYFFMFRPGQEDCGVAYQRGYGSAERPLDLLTEIRHGDAILVPHGYHGPTMAAPGYDLYGLNVMSGPATDGQWLSTDDPDHHWVRASWNDQPPDPRLPMY